MRLLLPTSVALLLLGTGSGLLALQQDDGFYGSSRTARTYSSQGENEKAEYYWSRLRYSSARGGFGGYGYFRGRWSQDYPKADRQFLMALRRLTRIQTRSTEQVVDLESDEIYNYPWVYAVQVQTWTFSEDEAYRLRQYLLRGGFIMVDDFHGAADWEGFMRGMLDDKGRVMVAICHNMHLGDAWEWADDPRYPEKFASLAFRLGINYIMYGMTH